MTGNYMHGESGKFPKCYGPRMRGCRSTLNPKRPLVQASQTFEGCPPSQRLEVLAEVVGADEGQDTALQALRVAAVKILTVASLTFGSSARPARWSRGGRFW